MNARSNSRISLSFASSVGASQRKWPVSSPDVCRVLLLDVGTVVAVLPRDGCG